MTSLNLPHKYAYLRRLLDRAIKYYRDLSTSSKLLLCFAIGVHQLFALIVWYYGPKEIFGYIANTALSLQQLSFGWLILVISLVIASFPPMIGYGMLISVCGFVYGFPLGILPAGIGSLSGASSVFLISRQLQKTRLFGSKLRALSVSTKFQAISTAITDRGIGLVVLLRLCPIPPWVYSNLGFSLLPPDKLTFTQFFFATILSTPRLFLHVFIGSRVFALSDPNNQLDSTTKILDITGIVAGMVLSTLLGWYVYRVTMHKISQSVDEEYNIDNESLLSELR
ncbi:hypothetical protein E3P86_02506 [Wallemia ichthyophaga]|uniref:Golgi apparatus membrane protein TVP38 n=1 Tax=Wallemia ichthyophaga TaxID=245174 RepID=A0A4T0J1I2_WALIC|nr:hypothetical protein E3P86_02506 [Wallemia ichthyophaga]